MDDRVQFLARIDIFYVSPCGGKAAGALSANLKNVQSYTSAPPYISRACLINSFLAGYVRSRKLNGCANSLR
jgi:hypothetical protein